MRSRVAAVLRSAIAVLTVTAVLLPFVLAWNHHSRVQQFEAAQTLVASHGGSLSFDLVDGNYLLELENEAASEAVIRALLPTLRRLPTGFTLVGPGESRTFWLYMGGDSLTESGLNAVLDLSITSVAVSNTSLTEGSVQKLIESEDLSHLLLNDVTISVTAAGILRSASHRMWIESDQNPIEESIVMSTPEMHLPDDLIEFLQSKQQFEYDADECEVGETTLVPLADLKLWRFPVDSSTGPNESGVNTYLVLAVDLIATCDDYNPAGLLLWLPIEKRYACWDDSHFSMEVFPPETKWTDIVAEPIRYLEASCGGAIEPIDTDPLDPSDDHPFGESVTNPQPV